MSDVTAFYEFNLFFAWYMLYAKEKHPDVYNDISNNKALRVVFTLLEDKYSKLVDKIAQQMITVNKRIGPDLMESLDFSGSEEDLFRFMEVAGMEPSQIYKEESKLVNGKSVMVKKCILSKDNYSLMKTQYDEVYKQLRTSAGSDLMIFFGQPPRSIAFMKTLYTKEVLVELDKLRIKGLTNANYQQYLK